MHCPHAALFDLDDTLAESFKSPSPAMLARLVRLLEKMPVAIVTGRDLSWMEHDFLAEIAASPHIARFFLFPEGAAQCLQWTEGAWRYRYDNALDDGERRTIENAALAAADETGVLAGLPVAGERFVQKRAMVAFAALGRPVPHDLKYSWDPGNKRRAALTAAIAEKLPDYDVLMGGATSIDITRKGVNKSLAVGWLAEHLKLAPRDMLYVGDTLFPGGNDAAVIPTGIETRQVASLDETAQILDDLIADC